MNVTMACYQDDVAVLNVNKTDTASDKNVTVDACELSKKLQKTMLR